MNEKNSTENRRWRNKIWRFSFFKKTGADLVIVLLATLASAWLSSRYSPLTLEQILIWLGMHIVVAMTAFVLCHVYRVAYRSFSVLDLVSLAASFLLITGAELLYVLFSNGTKVLHAFLYLGFLFLGTLSLRLVFRIFKELRTVRSHRTTGKRVIVVGAGAAGAIIIRELLTTDKVSYRPVAVVDDDPAKIGMAVCGIPVVGTTHEMKQIVAKYHATEIFVAMPSVSAKAMKEIYARCQVPGIPLSTLPGLYQLASGEFSVSKMREVGVQDLLGREQIKVNLDEIMGYISDEVVLVTGGGGSIGSELCRQIAAHRPRQLIIFDIYENNAYDIEQELRRKHDALNLLVLIGSIRDKGKLENLFERYRPTIVFNAAAHKHVPLMETSPCEAVKNNVFGTLNMARCADAYGVKRFVQISTDKAVNPTNIMGATKRICEMIVQTVGKRSKTEFVAVRFGNVLGSNGSVIPLFKRQIAEGGPVTVTHKDIVRYFMTIPEAVSLVLQAGAYAKGGEIYVLDMGEQVRIYDLAENLIRLSGYEPGVDIEIVCTGLRPGEKLYEERLMDEEGLKRTANESISIGKPLDIDEENLFRKLDALYAAAYAESPEMKELVHDLVPTYTIDKR